MTRDQRLKIFMDLGRRFDQWILKSDEELLAVVKLSFPAVSGATRDECLKFLTMDHVERLVR